MGGREHLRAFRRASEKRRREAMYEVNLVCGHKSFAHATHKGPVSCLECGTEKEIRFVGRMVQEI